MNFRRIGYSDKGRKKALFFLISMRNVWMTVKNHWRGLLYGSTQPIFILFKSTNMKIRIIMEYLPTGKKHNVTEMLPMKMYQP